MKFDGIIFDLDGTLWDSSEGICGTWQKVLDEYPFINEKITPAKLRACMGLPLDEIGKKLFPNLADELRHELMDKCCELENVYLTEHGGKLYPDLENILERLSKKHKLFIVSNCQSGYIESFLTSHKTAKYFTDIECIGNTGLSKGENNKLIIKRNSIKNAVYVGDTQGDADSAEYAGIPFIYASYGFGNVKEYDYILNTIGDIEKLEL